MARSAKQARTVIAGRQESRNRDAGVFLLCFSLLAGCSPHHASISSTRNADALFQLAKTEYKRGELTRARQDADIGYREFQNQPRSEWHWKFKLLYAEMQLWNGETNRSDRLLSQAPPADYPRLLPWYQMLEGYILFRREKDAEAEKLLARAADRAEALEDYELEADTELLLGSFFLDLDQNRAEAASQRALAIATARSLEFQKAAALVNLGMVQVGRAHYGDAIPYFRRAGEIAHKTGAATLNAYAIGNLATCYYNIGDLQPALKTQLQVVAAFQSAPHLTTSLRESYVELGNVYLLLNDLPHAIRCFRKALALVNESDSPHEYALIGSSLAQALESSGALDEAEHYNRKAMNDCDKRDRTGLAFLVLNEASIAADRKEYEGAIRASEKAIALGAGSPSLLWQAYASLGSTYAKTGDLPKAKLNFTQALRVIEENRSEQLRSEYKITFLSALIRFYQEYVALLMSQNEIEAALAVADSSRASVLAHGLRRRPEIDGEHLVAEVRKATKAENSVVLFYWLAPEHSYLWIITQREFRAISLPDEEQIAQDATSFRYAVEEEKQDPLANLNSASRRLYRTLIAPAADYLSPGSRVVIVPDGVLHNLNFEALPVDEPHPHYWLEDATVSIAPSLSLLEANSLESRSSKRPPAQESLLLFGDPNTAGTGFERLPQAALEIEEVRRHFPAARSVVYTGANASPDSYREADAQKFSIIHFAAHAEANEQSPLDSAIILSPRQNGYKLYARDVMEIPLTADLVTISACRGAGSRTLSGEGLVGFAWAFFQSGARNVVTSLWDVSDRSTADLMDRFYSGIEAGKPYAEALREAKIETIRSYPKPYYWAPFQLYSRSGGAR